VLYVYITFRCPVILDIGLQEIANLLKESGLHTKAMYCLKLIPDRRCREKNIQVITRYFDSHMSVFSSLKTSHINCMNFAGIKFRSFRGLGSIRKSKSPRKYLKKAISES